ncbi:hypothetical protein [Paenibacillus sp. NPDC055715]
MKSLKLYCNFVYGFRVALISRIQEKLDALDSQLQADGIEAAGFAPRFLSICFIQEIWGQQRWEAHPPA